jgi:hypothetical protein
MLSTSSTPSHEVTSLTPAHFSRACCIRLSKQQTDAKQQQPAGEELPIWVQREKMRELEAQAKPDLPWPLYLLLSSFVAIASVSWLYRKAD